MSGICIGLDVGAGALSAQVTLTAGPAATSQGPSSLTTGTGPPTSPTTITFPITGPTLSHIVNIWS